jgi:hypothetical protein
MIFLLLFLPLFLSAHNPEELVFNWEWIGNENELYFKMDLEYGLAFDVLYMIESNEKGQLCEISCKPTQDNAFITPDGYQLKNVQIFVTVENTESAREVFYKINAHHSYWKLDEEDRRTALIVEYNHSDLLLNSTIDVTVNPLFYTFIEDESSAVVRFTNLFRCSDP